MSAITLWAIRHGWTRSHAVVLAATLGAESYYETQCGRDFPLGDPINDVPEPAPAVGYDESHECLDDLAHAVQALARQAVADELCRIAAEADATADALRDRGYPIRSGDYVTFARALRSRAETLKG